MQNATDDTDDDEENIDETAADNSDVTYGKFCFKRGHCQTTVARRNQALQSQLTIYWQIHKHI